MPGARVPYQCMGQWSGSFNKGPPVGSGQWLQHVLLLVYLEHNKKYQKTSACSEGPPLPPLSFEEGVSQGSMFWRQHRVHLLPPVVGAPPPQLSQMVCLFGSIASNIGLELCGASMALLSYGMLKYV